jgi:general secretion pathway protein D
VRVLRNGRSEKRLKIFRQALLAGFAVLLSGCAGGLSVGADEPLIPLPVSNTAKTQASSTSQANRSDRDTPLIAPSGKRSAAAEPEMHFGSGEFVQEPHAVAGAAGAGGATVTGGDEVELNFAEANVREVAQSVLGTILGQNVVVDAGVEQRITLRTSRPIKKANLIPTLETTLAAAGLALVKDGELYRILPAAKARSGSGKSINLASDGELPPGSGVTVVRLEHIAPSQMAKILEPLAPEKSILRVDDPRNLMILSATGPEMKSLLETIETFDVSPLKGMSFGYFKLKNAKTTQVTGELNNLIKTYANQSGFNPPQIVPIERLNVLLVFASTSQTLKLTQRWIESLDQSRNEVESSVYVYRVKNRKARELAPLLARLFQTGGNAADAGARGSDTPPDTKTVELANAAAPDPTQANPSQDASRGDDKRKGPRIIADPGNNALLIRATPAEYELVVSALLRLDTIPPLVLVEVTIAEVTLNNSLQYGVEWFFKNAQQNTTTFSGINAGQILSKFPGFSYFFNAADVNVVLNAVAGVTTVKVLSSPKVMVLENKTATLQIGDQIPVVTSNAQSVAAAGAPVVQTIQYFDTGVILKVTPQVNSGGLITLDINQEVSNAAGTGTSPTIQQRKINSSIAIQSGEAIVLGGLIRENKSVSTTGIPLLSDIPSVGEVFKTHNNTLDRTELMVIITPKVVWDRSDAREATDEVRSKMQSIYGRR